MISRIGSDYGGWHIDLNLVTVGSRVISAGLGNDITFDTELIRLKKCYVIGIDPTRVSINHQNKLTSAGIISESVYRFLPFALHTDDMGLVMENATTNGCSMFGKKQVHRMSSISLPTLLAQYKNVSVLKMNIEGGEYPVLRALTELSVPQVLIRFHHRKPGVPFGIVDTHDCFKKMQEFGYEVKYESDKNEEKIDYEVLFVLNRDAK
jgi:hypothetical protein